MKLSVIFSIEQEFKMNIQNRVEVDIQGPIAIVTMIRAEKHNGLDRAMIEALVAAAKFLRKNKSIRVVVLNGDGDSFCAGLDFSYLRKNPGFIPRFFLKLPWSRDNMFQRVANIWRELPIPVIAAIHGNCFGGGFQIALGCDFRIAHPETRFSIMEMKWGLIPDMSAMVHLSRLTSLDIAQDLTMTGRIVSATEALPMGLVTRISNSPYDTAFAMAELIAKQSPDAVSAAKFLFRKTWKKDARGALLWERLTQLRLLGRKNQMLALKNGSKPEAERTPYLDRTSF